MFNRNHFALSAAFITFAATLYAITPVVITSTYTTYTTNVLTVYGSGFSTGATPAFIFNGRTLTVKGFTNTSIAATLPTGTNQGNYQVTIRNSQGQSATVSTAYDVDAADVDPALVADKTLKGVGTKASPLGIAVPLTLNSPGNGITPLTLGPTNNSAGIDPGIALAIPYGNIKISEGEINILSLYLNTFSASTYHGTSAITGTAPTGVYGIACCDDLGAFTGIYGSTGGLAPYAGYFDGNVHVNGNVSKAGGSFKIDHPLDPANKYLSHSFVESPDMMNVYNGNIFTDGRGNATVTLPDWFESLNRDFRYQLTVIGQFAQAIVAQKVTSNQFIIRTDKPNVEVSWQITGIRQDAWANAHRIPVEEEKPEKERDSYLHPELFNQPRRKSLEWVRHPAMMKKQAEIIQKTAQASAAPSQAQQ